MNEQLAKHNTAVLEHVNLVRQNLWLLVRELDHRGQIHDASKFEEPEASIFARNTDKLAATQYGTPEYQKLLEDTKVAIDHHYSKNRHHPEYHLKGVDDMDLVDIIEMLCDWKAATERNKNGNIQKSIDHNQERFQMSPQLAQILRNTVNRYF